MLVLIRGAGDLASGIALRLHHAHMDVVMTDLPQPTAIRRRVSFCQAISQGRARVEDVTARFAADVAQVPGILARGEIPVLADPEMTCLSALRPQVLVDAILAKRNLGTAITHAPCVIGVGPGFTPGLDCHAVVETMRGHTLGRVLLDGPALPNTAIPGRIGGFSGERVLRAPAAGRFCPLREIGDRVQAGEVLATVAGQPMKCQIDGVLRGILAEGTPVVQGMKAGDVDPRADARYCDLVSDKALAIGGGVLEAILRLTYVPEENHG